MSDPDRYKSRGRKERKPEQIKVLEMAREKARLVIAERTKIKREMSEAPPEPEETEPPTLAFMGARRGARPRRTKTDRRAEPNNNGCIKHYLVPRYLRNKHKIFTKILLFYDIINNVRVKIIMIHRL